MATEANGDEGLQSDLVWRMRQDDSAAFDLLIKQALTWLPAAAESRLPGKLRTRVSPDDIVQETLRRATADRAKFRGQNEAVFKGWLEIMLEAAVADEYRNHTRGKRSVLSEERDDKGAELAAAVRRPRGKTPTKPTEAARRNERAEKVRQALAKLEPEEQKILELRRFQDLEFSEIARRLEISVEGARSRYRRALDRFAAALALSATEL